MAAPRQWGMTPPVNTNFPGDRDLALTEALLVELKHQKTFEAQEDTNKRVAVLAHMQRVTTEFVKHVGKIRGLSDSVIQNAGGKVFTFGSYRLGVYGPGSDIDTLIVAPKHVSRDDFFEFFRRLLEEMSPPGAIEKCSLVPEAHVPIMKLEYQGIDLDLIFARLQLSSIPMDLQLEDNSLLRGLDDVDLRSVNGTRVTDDVLRLVPQEKTFRHALRAVKLWANRRAIYGNIVGFPGGIAWAMMVARVAQLYPNSAGSTLLERFFNLMKDWKWPQPIQLKPIESGPLQVRIWNPKIYGGDSRHLMPVITPAYPSMCATHNITKSTMTVISKEIERAFRICQAISAGQKQWSQLFEGHDFFTKEFKYYLNVISASVSEDSQADWKGLVQSKVRRLIAGIEMSQPNVSFARPFTKGFERVHRIRNDEEKDQVLQGSVKYQISETETVDVAQNVKQITSEEAAADKVDIPVSQTEKPAESNDGSRKIYTTTYYVGIELIPEATSLDISYPVQEFRRQCEEATQYNQEINSVRVVVVKSYDLPNDVFQPGEQRPVKAKKVKTKGSNKKRNAGEANLDDKGDAIAAAKRRPEGQNGIKA